jgi:hypothetical protein
MTRELLTWVDRLIAREPDRWALRVSVADIDRSGPFSEYAGIDRCFAVLSGAGVELTVNSNPVSLSPASDPISFSGDVSVSCELIGGPTRDLNLMGRTELGSIFMCQAKPLSSFGKPYLWRALFAYSAARLEISKHSDPVALSPGTLYWTDLSEPDWRLLDAEQAYWLGWTPRGTLPPVVGTGQRDEIAIQPNGAPA